MNTPPKFSSLPYTRPDFEAVQQALNALAQEAKAAPDYAALRDVIRRRDELQGETGFQSELAFIRCYLDSSDPYYAQEMQACSQGAALLDEAPLLTAILASPFAPQLDDELGKNYRLLLADNLKLSAKGQELRAECSQLENRYQQLKATLRISFDGKSLSEGQMTSYLQSPDREVRRSARLALHAAYAEKKDDFAQILDRLVEKRIALAKANGFESYMDFANLGMGRRDFGQKELLAFCEQVKEELVPLRVKLCRIQAERLGVDRLCSWDVSIAFPDGNPKPVGDGPVLLERGKEMYDKLDPEIGPLYRAMADNGYIDVTSSPNKIANMGFCTLLAPLKMPYVFGNCTGSPSDTTVLTHEVGHAYQVWLCMKGWSVPEYYSMPNDVVEIPSKTMEQFTSPFAELFFGKDGEKFRIYHMGSVVDEICVFCATHVYESWLYDHPAASLKERVDTFNAIMAEYDPEVDETELAPFTQLGTSLFRSMGVYMFPAYLISYALSDMGALEFRERARESFPDAWKDYRALCAAGGSLDYTGLMNVAHLHTAYAPGAVRRAAQTAAQALGLEL